MIIALAGFNTGITTVLFGFGGGFVVVPFVYQLLVRQPQLAGNAMHTAVATSTAVMIFNAGWVSYQNWRAGRLSSPRLVPAAVVYRHGRGGRFLAGGNIERGAGSCAFYPLYAGDDWRLPVAQRFLQRQRAASFITFNGHRWRYANRHDCRNAGRWRQRNDGAVVATTRPCDARMY